MRCADQEGYRRAVAPPPPRMGRAAFVTRATKAAPAHMAQVCPETIMYALGMRVSCTSEQGCSSVPSQALATHVLDKPLRVSSANKCRACGATPMTSSAQTTLVRTATTASACRSVAAAQLGKGRGHRVAVVMADPGRTSGVRYEALGRSVPGKPVLARRTMEQSAVWAVSASQTSMSASGSSSGVLGITPRLCQRIGTPRGRVAPSGRRHMLGKPVLCRRDDGRSRPQARKLHRVALKEQSIPGGGGGAVR